MFAKDKDTIGIILTAESLRLAQLKISSNEKKIADIIKKDLRSVSKEEVPNVLASLLAELKIKKPKAFSIIPSNQVTTKNIEIPSLDPEEIKSIIDLQAGRHTPYSREEILIGYISIGVFQRNYTKVLLAIIKRDVIKEQMDVFEQAGVRIEKVVFAPEAMARFYAEALQVKEEDIPVGIINIANQTADFTIEFNKTAATYRNIPYGMDHIIKEGESVQQQLADELFKSVEAYQNEDINKLPETYILTSDDAKVKELQPLLEEKLKAKIKVMPYLDLIEAPQPVMLKIVSEYNDDSFLDLIACGVSLPFMQVDLTPDEIKTKRVIEEKGREVMKLGIFSCILLVLICSIFFSKIFFQSVFFDKLKEDYIKYHKKVMVLDNMAQKTRLVKDYVNNRMTTLDIINELYMLIPDEIYLESVVVLENGNITLQGVSESMSRVFNFVSALEDSLLFKGVKTTSTSAKKDRGKDAAAFSIALRLESAPDIVEEEAPLEGEEAVQGEAASAE